MNRFALVAVGGLVGSVARVWLTGAVQQVSAPVFPFGTLVVNLLGSLVIGTVATLSLERGLRKGLFHADTASELEAALIMSNMAGILVNQFLNDKDPYDAKALLEHLKATTLRRLGT